MSVKLIKLALGGTSYNLPLVTALATATPPSSATAEVRYDSDGSVYEISQGTQTNIGAYVNPASVAPTLYIRITRTSGELAFTSGPALNTWHQLNTDRLWTLTAGSGTGVFVIEFTAELATDSAGTNIVDTQTGNTLTAESSI